MDDKEKEEFEEILNRSRQIQVVEIKEREKQRQKDKAIVKKDLLEINDESEKVKEELIKSKTSKTSLKCNLL